MGRSNSEDVTLGSLQRASYLFTVLGMHIDRLRATHNFRPILDDVAFYQDALQRYAGKQLTSATVLEIGYGQRPFRLIALYWIGVNAFGVDLDEPVYELNATRILRLLKTNSLTRSMKSIFRRAIFDASEYRKLSAMLQGEYGSGRAFDPKRLLSGDSSKSETWAQFPDRIDMVFSEDVFEHIPSQSIPRLLKMMAARMSDQAIAVIKPAIFTGITGGHDLDWYPHRVAETLDGRTVPWGHLTGEAGPADTFLNRLKRSEYRAMFEKDFIILEENDPTPRLGEQYLTSELRAKLAEYSDEDLFSNKIRFVLRKRPTQTSPLERRGWPGQARP
jgi:Methyltransferase domain